MVKSIRAFSSPEYDYYKLTKDFGLLKAGTIFYHDQDDDTYGSMANGCLKNCWTPDGNCFDRLCGGTVILHTDFINTDWFEKVERTVDSLAGALPCGCYTIEVNQFGSYKLQQFGGRPKWE